MPVAGRVTGVISVQAEGWASHLEVALLLKSPGASDLKRGRRITKR
jgi:hypothetical protein